MTSDRTPLYKARGPVEDRRQDTRNLGALDLHVGPGTLAAHHLANPEIALQPALALAQRYAANTTRDLSHLTWYTVLACFKLGIVIEGTLARACAGKAEKEVGDQLHAATVHLFERALGLIEG